VGLEVVGVGEATVKVRIQQADGKPIGGAIWLPLDLLEIIAGGKLQGQEYLSIKLQHVHGGILLKKAIESKSSLQSTRLDLTRVNTKKSKGESGI